MSKGTLVHPCRQSTKTLLFLRENLIQQQVNQHPRHRHIHPHRPGPARDFFVLIESLPDGEVHRNDDHWHNRNRENQVREKQREVNRPEPHRVAKSREAVVAKMINQIAGQKDRGTAHRRNHAIPMRDPVAAFDEVISEGKEYPGQTVEKGVGRRQVVVGHRRVSLSEQRRGKAPRTNIQAPEKFQGPNSKTAHESVGVWNLVLPWSLDVGAWSFI
jgi:hypothetical protein